MKKTSFSAFLFLVFSFFLVQCASDFRGNLEEARFALDKGNYTVAITAATAALVANPGDVEASRVLANAYFGRSGLNFLDILEGIVDLDTAATPNFRAISDVLPSSADLSDLRTAITTLESVTGIDEATITDEVLANAAFDLAMMQMLEHFARGVYGSDFYGTFDVSGVDDTDRQTVQEDLVEFDNRMIASGVDSAESFISEIRQTFCILEPISAGSGFAVEEYRDLVNCQLADDPTTVTTTTVANCVALEPDGQTADVQSCYDVDTAL